MRITESRLRQIIREARLRQIIKEEIMCEVERPPGRPDDPYRRRGAGAYSRMEEVRVVSPFMWYENRLFVVVEFERFIGGPRMKTGFYTSTGSSIPDTEHMSGSWQPCLGINKPDGWIKKFPEKWVQEDHLIGKVSNELSKRYDKSWQQKKVLELFRALRRSVPGGMSISKSELSETQIDPINAEFRRHGVLFEKNFVNRRLERGEDIDDYYDFSQKRSGIGHY